MLVRIPTVRAPMHAALPARGEEPDLGPVWVDEEGDAHGCDARTQFEIDDEELECRDASGAR